jgi:sec-independent protein translocase protein TatA
MFTSRMIVLASLLNIFEGPQGIFILLLILLLFGAKKLPELARGMGKAIREFQKAKDEFSDELHRSTKTDETEANTSVKAAQSTVPRTENAPTAAVRQDPSQSTTPAGKADQV